MKEVPFLNLLAASWIQFQNSDWITHGEMLQDEVIEIPLDEDDPARAALRSGTDVHRPDPTRPHPAEVGEPTPVTHINEVTHWWDGSQIYGSDQATQDRLRSGVDGHLRLTRARHPPAGVQRRRGQRDDPQLVGRRGDAAHAVRQGAQRHL